MRKRADIADAKAGRFSRHDKVLRVKRCIHRGDDELFGQPFGCLAAMHLAAPHGTAEVGAEDEKFRCLLDIALATGDPAKRLSFPFIRNPDDCHALKKAGTCRRLRGADQRFKKIGGYRCVGKAAYGAVTAQKINRRVHGTCIRDGWIAEDVSANPFRGRAQTDDLHARRFSPFHS